MSRLPYVALLVCAIFAIVIGLFPTYLIVGAILAVPVGIIALVGAISPTVISSRPWLRRTAMVTLVIFGSEFVIVTSRLAATRRRPVELVIDGTEPRLIRVVYGVTDGARHPFAWTRRIVVPSSNVALVRYPNNGRWYTAANPHPLRVTTRSGARPLHNSFGAWTGGGYTDGGACHFEYDEYSVGDKPSVQAAGALPQMRTGWLDSLSTWGVDCRDGKLVRSKSRNASNLRRTGPACYYFRDGAVGCSDGQITSTPQALPQ